MPAHVLVELLCRAVSARGFLSQSLEQDAVEITFQAPPKPCRSAFPHHADAFRCDKLFELSDDHARLRRLFLTNDASNFEQGATFHLVWPMAGE